MKTANRGRVLTCASVLTLACMAHPACAQTPSTRSLLDLNLEDLMKIEITSVSRKAENLRGTASAAFVITAEDIRRSGATSIPEALRMAPGVDVARISSGSYAVTTRGINGRFANKLLVLMDGRSIYSPLFSGALWENEDTLIEDIERIEVIRGPNAAQWGSNAVNGVINIITKSARATHGGLAAVTIGTEERGGVSLRYGGRTEGDVNWRVYAKGTERGPGVEAGGADANDRQSTRRIGFRADGRAADGGDYTVLGDAQQSRINDAWLLPALIPPYATRYGFPIESNGFNLLARSSGSTPAAR
jgi:iron complex outermembrane recepter protein